MNLEADWQIVEQHRSPALREEAFEAFVSKYKPSLYSLCYRLTKNQDDAADAWQEVLLQIDRSLKNFKNDSSLYTWAYRIALNVCLNFQRGKNRAAKHFATEVEPAEIENMTEENPQLDPEAVCQATFKQFLVQKNLHKLPDNQRTVLILHTLEGFTLAEIAATLKIKENAVKARLRRANLAFKDLLEKDFEKLGIEFENSALGCTSKLS